MLLASAMNLLGASNVLTGSVLLALIVLAGPVWMLLRRRHGFPATPRRAQEAAISAE